MMRRLLGGPSLESLPARYGTDAAAVRNIDIFETAKRKYCIIPYIEFRRENGLPFRALAMGRLEC